MGTTTANPELQAFYSNRRLLWRNIALILLMHLGWSACFNVINPLIQLGLYKAGLGEKKIALLSMVNSWAYSYLVMYFAWRSDHTVSRFGRRIPYLFLSAPFIITAVALFPFFHIAWILVALALVEMLFMDIKAATIPLLNIDCVPRQMLARVNAMSAIGAGAVNFLAMRYGMRLADYSEYAPFVLAGCILTVTTLAGGFFIKEPPVRNPTADRFKPWSAMAVAWRDKRAIVLMLGVGLIWTFAIVYNQWVWLFAKAELGLSRADIGDAVSWSILLPMAISYPVGWIIDRFGSYRVVIVYWLLTCVAAWWAATRIHDAMSLAVGALLVSSMGPLYNAADILVYRKSEAKHVGSVTSTNSCLRGLLLGLSVLFSGLIVERCGGHYQLAFLYGAAASTLGFGLIMLYGYLTRGPAGGTDAEKAADSEVEEMVADAA